MRPRPDAAETGRTRPGRSSPCRGFNEAAARCRGNQARTNERPSGTASGFNEAAARCRGNRDTLRTSRTTEPCFNEAAARCRGNPLVGVLLHAVHIALQ